MSFGENLLGLRKGKNISQDELGRQLNVSRQTISKWELNETTPEMEKLILLSEFFNVSIDELIKGQKPEPKEEKDTFEIKVTKAKKTTRDIIFLALKVVGIIFGIILLVDIIVMIIYFATNGFPSL
ncbi:helix-turn-helix transcriptional regulator [Sedimentibacter sp. zth1]|uniref:helix-turn-helix domain-containing protein n=1 Tax=Sedimentibacter sp. zth1 TaxID=2816908 RepID=UPI001A933A59|nr:helix-turn-helix transcriptional regulator [Sedimentibacter sp. zth1]QSX05693.1 helix-turn-helix transcriptional regulator [Sedimentibacter sp. zth1]